MTVTTARIDRRGRITIPAAFRRALGLEPGAAAFLTPDAPELRVTSLAEQIRRAQEAVRRYVPAGKPLAQELIAQRRREADRPRNPA